MRSVHHRNNRHKIQLIIEESSKEQQEQEQEQEQLKNYE